MAASLLHYHLYSNFNSSRYTTNNPKLGYGIRIRCSDSSAPKGFQPKSRKPSNDDNKNTKSSPKQSFTTLPNRAPSVSSQTGGSTTKYVSPDDLEFEQRLQAVKKSALEQKKAEQVKDYGPIDYDAPIEKNDSTIGLGTKIGVGIAVAVFGLVFAFGDFLPTVSVTSTEDASTVNTKIPEEERKILEKRLKQFEETLAVSPEDSTALEGAAVTLAEMREYKRAAETLEKLTEKKPDDPDVFRLLGEVKYELKDYEGSVVSYKSAAKASKEIDFEILRGLTNSLLASKKPDEAVQVLVASRERLNKDEIRSNVDAIQVDLFLGKAYSDWGHISDAVAVYDQLISKYPNDFRGYLAKGIILKENGNIGDAERMFIQARFFAPDKAKALVDKYSR